jgi:formate-dependent nitrite reductase membrane component NrfD
VSRRESVPEASFASYYGRQILKDVEWKSDIPAYFFLGGLSAGASLLGAGADVTGRPSLRRTMRMSALGSLGIGTYFLIHDLGRPSRFVNMLRVFRPTSPMNMGSWLLAAYGPMAGLAAVGDVIPALRPVSRLAGFAAAAMAPAIATYTAVLTSNTAVPAWHEAYPELPFVYAGSAASAAGGLGMALSKLDEAGPARRLAAGGMLTELAASQMMERRLGLVGEPYRTGSARLMLRLSGALTGSGALVGLTVGRRSRGAAVVGGIALVVGSALSRFGIMDAGRQSVRDPRYVVIPQAERVDQRENVP